jgi:hypothetical protein
MDERESAVDARTTSDVVGGGLLLARHIAAACAANDDVRAVMVGGPVDHVAVSAPKGAWLALGCPGQRRNCAVLGWQRIRGSK